MTDTILSIDTLSKHYGRIKAVDGISLTIPKGSVFGILGPNGSGKTTTLGMVLDVIQPKGGSFAWFDNRRGPKALQRIGAILEHPNFFTYLSGEDNLKIVADIKRVSQSRVGEVLDLVQLSERAGSKFKTYSLGMKQRLAIAGAMLNEPEVLVLDEPTNGLDPQGIAQVRDLIKSIAAQGVTILLASHLLDEVEKVCSHVAVLKKGNLLYSGEVSGILGNKGMESWIEVMAPDKETLRSALAQLPGVSAVTETESSFQVFSEADLTPEKLNELLANQGVYLSYLNVGRQKLEAQFLELTNNN